MADFGLKAPISAVLQNLLKQYPSGGQFIFEALQNAEDTDGANKFCALLDLRSHASTGRCRPCSEECVDGATWRERLLGPAIVFYDNGGFVENDWRSLQRIYVSEKRHVPHKAGMYGMGSRSFFHIGDVIQIVSGSSLAHLDPDNHVSTNCGERVNFVEENLVDTFPDECRPFVGLFGCDMRAPFKGTIMRVPLRLAEWASESSFMAEEFSEERAEDVLQEFLRIFKESHMVLFMSNITEVALFRWGRDDPEITLLAETTLTLVDSSLLGSTFATKPFSEVKAFLKNFTTVPEPFRSLGEQVCDGMAPEVCDVITLTTRIDGEPDLKFNWLRFGRFFKEHTEFVAKYFTVPIVVAALPLLEPCEGCLFTHLPLPIVTGLPIHIHAGFVLQDNRRSLWRQAKDQDGQHRDWATWNEYILEHAIPLLYADALKLLTDDTENGRVLVDLICKVYSLWPDPTKVKQEYDTVLEAFVQHVQTRPVLLGVDNVLRSPGSSKCFSTTTDALQALRPRLIELCREAALAIVELPTHVEMLLVDFNVLIVEDCLWVLTVAVLPRGDTLLKNQTELLTKVLFAFMDWAGSDFTTARLSQLRDLMLPLEWLPSASNRRVAIPSAFDPETDLPKLRVVRDGIAELVQVPSSMRGHVLAALRACGLKNQITWQDAVLEAEHIADVGKQSVSDGCKSADLLWKHIHNFRSAFGYGETIAVEKLRRIAWIPGMLQDSNVYVDQPADLKRRGVRELLALDSAFPEKEFDVVWAVAPTLARGFESQLLKPGYTLEQQPERLVAQLDRLITAVESFISDSDDEALDSFSPPVVSAAALTHFKVVFDRLAKCQGLSRLLEPFRQQPRRPLLPCTGRRQGTSTAVLFPSGCAATTAKNLEVEAVVGLVLHDFSEFATNYLQVPEYPPADLLIEKLSQLAKAAGAVDGKLSPQNVKLARALTAELADRLSQFAEGEERPEGILVLTSSEYLRPVKDVYIDDAKWTRSTVLETLHPDLSSGYGRELGCTSVRDKLAQQCEDDDNESFGQDANLVDQVKQLLRDYGARGDVIKEFVQNTDDFGADTLVFLYSGLEHNKDQIVDERAACLQGPALYICSNKALTPEDINRMQRVGRSDKRLDFSSTGRFGVGLNVMYRYSDCPQLLANGSLHFFDLTRRFVARDDDKRGKKYKVELLREHFPDSYEPFIVDGVDQYEVVFRLPLRTTRSEVGLRAEPILVKHELEEVAKTANTMLLFTRHLRRLLFKFDTQQQDLTPSHHTLIEHVAAFENEHHEAHENFFRGLPEELGALREHTLDLQVVVQKTITSVLGEERSKERWAVAHFAQLSNEEAKDLCDQLYDQPNGVALLPLGAAAANLDGSGGPLGGRLCCCLATPMVSTCRTWFHGSFVMESSRKGITLPEEHGTPTLEQKWNIALLNGAVALSLRNVMLFSKAAVTCGSDLNLYFGLVPDGSTIFSKTIGEALTKSSADSAIFPVSSGLDEGVRWASGPLPCLRCRDLRDDIQDALAYDGLDLVDLPAHWLQHHKAALGDRMPNLLTADVVVGFLKRRWAETRAEGGIERRLDKLSLKSLKIESSIVDLLRFVVKHAWNTEVQRGTFRKEGRTVDEVSRKQPVTFPLDTLQGVPLLLTRVPSVATFGATKYFPKFKGHDVHLLLPEEEQGCFMDGFAVSQTFDVIDATDKLVEVRVKFQLPGVRQVDIEDLLEHRSYIEQLMCKSLGFKHEHNRLMRVVWELIKRSRSLDLSVLDVWSILPVLSPLALPGSLYTTVCLRHLTRSVASHYLQIPDSVRVALHGVLFVCGIVILDTGFAKDDMVNWLDGRAIFCDLDLSNWLLRQEQEHGCVRRLGASQKETLLWYFSLVLESEARIEDAARQLPIFLTSAGDFVNLMPNTKYCSLQTGDQHLGALEKLVPPDIVLLAYPTMKAEKIYRACGIQLCTGEDFMLRFLIPHLQDKLTKCSRQWTQDELIPLFEELHAFIVIERSPRVFDAAKCITFIPALDGHTMAKAKDLLDPNLDLSVAFRTALEKTLPQEWVCVRPRCFDLLKTLGLKSEPTTEDLLECARDLDSLAGQSVTKNVEKMSRYFVESFAKVALPADRGGGAALPGCGQPVVSLAGLAQVGELRVIVARSCEGSAAVGKEAKKRAGIVCDEESAASQLVLTCFRGVAFGSAEALLWSVSPCCSSNSQINTNKKRCKKLELNECANLERLVKEMPDFMENSLGALVRPSSIEPQMVMTHLANVCSHVDFLMTKSTSLWSDLTDIWEYCNECAENATINELLSALGASGMNCVPVLQRVFSDLLLRFMDRYTLKPVQTCFVKQPPPLWAFLDSVALTVETSCQEKYGAVFTRLGVKEDPDQSDYAIMSGKFAERMLQREVRELATTFDVEALLACAVGFDESLRKLDDDLARDLLCDNFMFLDRRGNPCPTTGLVLPEFSRRIQERCESGLAAMNLRLAMDIQLPDNTIHKTVQIPSGDIAESLIKFAGLRKLSDLVEERQVVDESLDGVGSTNNLAETLQEFVRSPQFEVGLVAMCGAKGRSMSAHESIFDVRRCVEKVTFTTVDGLLQSAFFWIDIREGEEPMLPDSYDDKFFFCAPGTSTIFVRTAVHGDCYDREQQRIIMRHFTLAVECALRSADMSFAEHLRTDVLDSMLCCFFCSGVAGIENALKQHEELQAFNMWFHGIGDEITYDIKEKLVQSFDGALSAREPVVVLHEDRYILGVVDEKQLEHANEGLAMLEHRYAIVISPKRDILDVQRLHIFQLDRSTSQPSEPPLDFGELALAKGSEPRNVAATRSAEVAKLKNVLNEMGRLRQNDYKVAARRLFKQWHPDKAHDVPESIATELFRAVRAHSDWYETRRPGQEFDWSTVLREDAEAQQMPEADDAQERYCATPSKQATWFQEFEKEFAGEREQRAHQQRDGGGNGYGGFRYAPPAVTGAVRGPPRIVDEVRAEQWLQQAEMDLLAARKLAHDDNFRSLPGHAIWLSEQALASAAKSYMFRTCGITEDELQGRDLEALIEALMREHGDHTAVPASLADVTWLWQLSSAARRPGAGHTLCDEDAVRALDLAQAWVQWSRQIMSVGAVIGGG